jgi:hypothetical protein
MKRKMLWAGGVLVVLSGIAFLGLGGRAAVDSLRGPSTSFDPKTAPAAPDYSQAGDTAGVPESMVAWERSRLPKTRRRHRRWNLDHYGEQPDLQNAAAQHRTAKGRKGRIAGAWLSQLPPEQRSDDVPIITKHRAASIC